MDRLGSASLLYAPMLWEDRGLGSILVVRSPPRPFSEREQALLQSFADQAAIAIENARLFRETQEALQQQTATADVLKVISRSAVRSQDRPADTRSIRQCELCSAPLTALYPGETATFSWLVDPIRHRRPKCSTFEAQRPQAPVRYPMHGAGRARAGEIAHFPDALADSDYHFHEGDSQTGGYRAIIVRAR